MEFVKEYNRYLNDEEMDNNAKCVYEYLSYKGWSKNSISALCSNMWKESTLNPALFESFQNGNYNVGFGLVQWTPATKFTNWAINKGKDIYDGYAQLDKLCEEVTDGSQWIPTSFSQMTFEEFIHSEESPSFLSVVFIKNYERPFDDNQPDRYEKANYFFNLFDGHISQPTLNKCKIKNPYDFLFKRISFSKNEFELVKKGTNISILKNNKTNRKYLVNNNNFYEI